MAMQVKWFEVYPAFLETLVFMIDTVPSGDLDFAYDRLMLRTLELANVDVTTPLVDAGIDQQQAYFQALVDAFERVKPAASPTSDAEVAALKAKVKDAKKELDDAKKEKAELVKEKEKLETTVKKKDADGVKLGKDMAALKATNAAQKESLQAAAAAQGPSQ
jgi:hypothetical protein